MKTASDIIADIALHTTDLKSIKYVLEDGEALTKLGYSDGDEDEITTAHYVVTSLLDMGFNNLDDVK